MVCRTVVTAWLRQRHHIRDLEPFGSGTVDPEDSDTLLSEDAEVNPSEMLLAALGRRLSRPIQRYRPLPLRAPDGKVCSEQRLR